MNPTVLHDVAVLGLGAMGSRMAANLLRAGHRVTVWNRSPGAADALVTAGARRATSPRSAVAGADFVIAMVRNDEASRHVWCDPDAGALAGMTPGAVAIGLRLCHRGSRFHRPRPHDRCGPRRVPPGRGTGHGK